MSHRYGRHGPRAWLRWRKRHHRMSTLPVLVQPEIRVIRVRIPFGIAERIIYIIMSNNGDFIATSGEDPRDSDPRSLQPYSSSIPSLPDTEHRTPVVSTADNELRESARIAAGRDLRSFSRARDLGKGVSIDSKLLIARSEDLADQELTGYRSRHLSITSTEYDRLLDVYTKAYMDRVREVLNDNASEVVWWLEDRKEAELRQAAIRDKEIVRTIGPDSRLSHHRRDLGELRVMALYGIELSDVLESVDNGNLATLEKMHRMIDRYDEYQKRSGNEVIWPTEATFQ